MIKVKELNSPAFVSFVDHTKAFDMVRLVIPKIPLEKQITSIILEESKSGDTRGHIPSPYGNGGVPH